MKNYLLVNRALAAEKNFYLISKLFHDEVMSRASRGQVEGNTCVEHFSHKALMLLTVLVMSVANIGMAWAWATNVYLNGNFTGDNWSGSSAYSSTYQFKLQYNSTDGKFYIPVYATGSAQYFRLWTNNHCGPATNNKEIDAGDDGCAASSYDEHNWKYVGDAGIISICIDQTGGKDWNPWVWVERPDIYIRHKWNNSSLSNQKMTDNRDGTYHYIGKFSSSAKTTYIGPCSSCESDNVYFKKWTSPTMVGSPTNGDRCIFEYNASGYKGVGSSTSNMGTITITKLYSITYDGNGKNSGTVPTGVTDKKWNETTTIADNTGTLAKTGYVFAGWNTAADGTGTYYAPGSTFTPSAASTTLYAQWLTVHTPGLYETAAGSGGYGQSLVESDDLQYEVYQYAISSSKVYVYAGTSTTSTSAANYMLHYATSGGNALRNWMLHSGGIYGSTDNSTHTKEFQQNAKQLNINDSYKHVIAVSGFDQFSIYAKDKTVSSQQVEIYINGSKVTAGSSTSLTVRRYNLTPETTYIIRIEAIGSGSNASNDLGFSLRVPSVVCGATQPGTISKGTLSACSLPLTAAGSAASNNTWYWQSSSTGTDKTESGATKNVTSTGTYYIRSYYSTGSCWSEAQSIEVTASDLTPAAPTALAAASPTAKGITLSVTDANDVNNYEFYVSTSNTAPEAGATATHSVSSAKSLTITNLVAGTTYYAWARSVCGVSNKSGWTALTGNTFTTSTVTVTHTLTNVTKTSGATTAGGSDYTAEFAAVSGYSMPTPTVTIDGNTATSGTDYTWNAGTGTITIPANKINGNIVITLNSVPSAPSSAVISGTYHYFPGENISLTCTPSGNNGPTTYQWYKGGKENGNAIEGATSATYTKNSCTFDDAGSYYCKVTCNATSIWANTNSSENYDVKILRLYVNGSKSGDPYGNVDFVKVNATTATASISLGSGWTYGFNIADGCGHYYGNAGTMTENNCGPWVTNVNGTDCGLTTTNAATYIFTINYSNLSMITTSVTYPSANQASGKVIYFDNNVLKWTGSSIYYRIGHSSHTQADQLSLVPGTANLYKMTTREYNNFSAWQIGNAEGDNGSGKSIYNTKNSPAITASTAYEGGAVTEASVTVTPGVDHSTGGDEQNNNCEFYSKTITNGMKTDNVAISDYSNGTITVNYTNTSGSAATLTSGNADLAHTVILTSITAEPNTGYDASAITINGGAYSANYVVTGATTIAASFTPHVYNITYKDQGGSAFSGVHADGYPTTHTYGSTTALKGATKAGYTFGGWFGNSACTGVALSSIGGTDYSVDITLYAKWTVNQYSVTHTLSNVTTSSGATGANAATYGTNYTAVFAASSGYALPESITVSIGGSTKTAGTEYTWNQSTGTVVVTGSYILGDIVITITGEEACEKPTAPASLGAEDVIHSSARLVWDGGSAGANGYKIKLESATGAGTFGWTDWAEAVYDATGLTESTTYTFYVKYKGTGGQCEFSDEVTVDFTTNAASTYTVTFNSNGGSAVSPITQASAGASIAMPAAPTYASHTFQGWVIGGNTYAAGASYTPAANVTAYATWKANCAGGGSGSTEVYNGENVAKGSTTASGWTINNSSTMTLTSGSSNGYSYWYQAGSSTNYVQFDGSASLVAGDQIKIQWTHTSGNKDLALTINGSGASLTSGGHVTTANTKMEAVYDVTSDKTVTSIKLNSSGSGGCKIYQVTIVKASGGGCCYVTYNGNGAQSGCISDKTAYTAGEGDVTILGNTGVSAYVKLGYRFNGWNTAANGIGMAYAAGDVVENISNDLTLHAQWVLDACSAPAAPTISGTASRTEGQTISLTASCASGADGSTTYTWYKGVDWATASAAPPVQAAMTAGEGGRTYSKASCVTGDAGKYWCEASNGTGCEANNETGFTVTVSAAVEEHIYYYKDANHYSEGTYSNPEGNEAVKKDNQSLSSPWMICNGCKTGVDSVVAHGATYDGKDNYMNAYIKLPTGGNATTKNIKFALTAGYTGTLTMKIGGYENNPTVTLQPLNTSTGELGETISYSGTVGGVATTEDNFNTITWNLTTAGGTYVLTVTSKTGYISQIDMTTSTSATFRVTYDGNGKTDGTVPSDATNYAANASVTVQAQGDMEKDNYTFGGWNTADDGTGTNYVAGSGTFKITGATTLYAHWTQSIYLAPGAHGTGTNGATVSWNGTAVRGFTAHTAAGYSLTGYYTAISGGTKVLNSDGSFAATNVTDYITDGKWSRTGAEATLYAQWSGSAIVTNTLGVGSSSKWKSTISTTAPLQITSLSALAAVGGLAIEDANGTSASGRALTCKVEASGATTKTDGKYLQLSFSIAAGYKLRVTGLDVTVRSVSKAGKYHLELVGTTGSLIPDDEQVASGAVNTIFDDAYNVELTGDVTLKLWAYGADSDNKMSTYRLGSPIAIYGAVEESCTPPTFSGLDYSATEYTQGAAASAISVTGAENVGSYQWKYNTVNDRTSGTNCGTGASVTPATDASATTDGTRYYWCELTNGCTTVKTSTVAVTVSASASNPTVTWSSVSPATVNYGGGNYTLRATVNETGWSGTLVSSMITAPAGITIHDVTTGTAEGKRYIEFKFDVTTAFDREANDKIGFHLSLPAISGWNALTSDKQVSYTACDEGSGVAGQVAIPLTATAQTSASNPQNYWEVAEAGWLAFNYGSAVSVLPAATAYRTSEVDFGYYVASTNKKKWMFQPYIAGVNKVRVAFRAAGNLSSGQASVSKFYYDTEYFSSPGSHENLIGDVSANQATYTSGENGYIEFTVPEMAANSYGAFELENSSIEIYGIVLYSENTGSGGTIETDPTWSGGLNKDGSSVVDKAQGAANFTYTISTTTNTLGGISYSSSNPSVAEVNATTGEVRITATGNTEQTAVITATLARSGCYQPATRTYTVRVAGSVCPDPIGTIEAEDLGCSGTRLTFSGYAAGATIQWYQNDSPIADDGGDANVYTATAAGNYYAVAHLNCDRQSNTIVVTAAEVDADRVVEKWYIKNGRLTPDIKLWTLDEGSHLVSVAWSPSNATGLDQGGDIYESDGAVYLTGRAPGSNDTGADIEYTLTLTINNGCTGSTTLNDASKQITIVHQKNTDKHVLAFVVTGKEKGGFTESIPASQTTSVDLYNEIAKNFDVLATNIYATDDEQKIKEYYSQFDIICITDYPNTKTKGSHSVSYSDAIGVMVDIRPVLTMEAWVSGLANWKAKGISGDPKSPTTRQYSMLLQCKDHEIFAGTTLTEVGEGDDKMYRIHMVDETLHPYDTLDANYGSGTHESKKGYRYGSYPALQGFTFSQAMLDADLLPLGLIDDGAGKDLQVGLERQHEMSARMMVLGINSTAMERLTDDGETVVINALKYLMKKSAEEIADCSTSFVGGAEGDEENWMNADNWTGNTVPDKTQKVRILAPCVIPAGERAHVAGVLIAPEGGTYNATPTTGSLTIASGGALIVIWQYWLIPTATVLLSSIMERERRRQRYKCTARQ